MKENNGITLVALVVTIVMIMILATVSIRIVLNGDDSTLGTYKKLTNEQQKMTTNSENSKNELYNQIHSDWGY